MAMSSTVNPRRSAFSTDWAAERPVVRPVVVRDQTSRGFARFLITFCLGIGATLAWQSYGDAARKIVAGRYPQLAWLAPQTTVTPSAVATILPLVSSVDPQELKTISSNLAVMRQRIDELAASQNQITRNIDTNLQVAKQELLSKIATLSLQPAPARRPASPTAGPVR
jgi:hypothetical protein